MAKLKETKVELTKSKNNSMITYVIYGLLVLALLGLLVYKYIYLPKKLEDDINKSLQDLDIGNTYETEETEETDEETILDDINLTDEEKKEFELLGMDENSLKNLGIAIGIQVGAQLGFKFGPKLVSKITPKIVKSMLKAIKRSIRAALSKIYKLIIKKFASKTIQKFGVSLGSMATKLGLKIAYKTAASVGGKAAVAGGKALSKLGLGPVGVALLAFDILSIGLDIGDAGGYGLMDKYMSVKKEIDKVLKKEFGKLGIEYPFPIGPINKLQETDIRNYEDKLLIYIIKFFKSSKGKKYVDNINELLKDLVYDKNNDNEWAVAVLYLLDDNDKQIVRGEAARLMCESIENGSYDKESQKCMYDDEYTKLLNKIISDIMSEPNNPYLTPILEEITEKNITDENEINEFIDKKMKNINFDEIIKKANQKMCLQLNGKMLSDGNCTYKTEAECNKHYKMTNQMTDKKKMVKLPQGSYTVWDSKNKKCMVAPYAIKQLCDENKLGYNPTTGGCVVTKNLCLKKGLTWKNGDCYITDGQEVLEFIFGTTVVRGLKQVFDLDQYKPCKKGEIDQGYFCSVCPKNTKRYLSLCYRKPKSVSPNDWKKNWTAGVGYVRKKCPSGYGSYDFISNTCKKGGNVYGKGTGIAADCPSGYMNLGVSCEPRSYGRGVGVTGKVVNNYKCPKGYKYVWGVTDISGKCPKKGTWGWTKKPKKEKKIPKSPPPRYSKSSGNKVPDPGSSKRKWEKCGLLYYPKCPSGTKKIGCNICRTKGKTFLFKSGYDKMKCSSHKQSKSPGYTGPNKNKTVLFQKSGALCYPPCESGYTNDGLTCRAPIKTKSVKKIGVTGTVPRSYAKKRAYAYSTKKN
jgi:hypothetical protein